MNNVLKAREELLARTEKETQQIVDTTNLPSDIKDFFSVWNTDTAFMVSAEDMPEFNRLADALTEKTSVLHEEIESKYHVRVYRDGMYGMMIEGFVNGELLRANLDRTSDDPYRVGISYSRG